MFSKFREWKAPVELCTGEKLKVLRSDNGGEYTSEEFAKYLRAEGIRHELTVPKTPQQDFSLNDCIHLISPKTYMLTIN